jgi:hypothetical protein
MPLSGQTVKGAAASGRVRIITYLIQRQRCQLPSRVDAPAAYSGSVDKLQFVRENGCMFSYCTCRSAARFGQMHALRYVMSTLACTCDQQSEEPADRCDLCEWIAASSISQRSRSVHAQLRAVTLRWCSGCSSCTLQLSMTTQCKGLQALARLLCALTYTRSSLKMNYPKTHACNAAAQHGHVETLDWLVQHGYPWSVDRLRRSAAQGGSISLMR